MARYRDEKLLAEIASRIKKLRKKQNITLQEFFDETGIHLARIEASQGNVTLSTLKIVCKHFGISLEQLLKGL